MGLRKTTPQEGEIMSTRLLYQAFGIRGYQYRSVDFFEGRVCFNLEQPREKYRCPECNSAAVHAQGHKDRFLQTIPIGLKPTFLLVKVPRVICFR
jgi:transposase